MNATCKVCDRFGPTAFFNIKFQRTPICESCADSITVQQVTWLVRINPRSGEPDVAEVDGIAYDLASGERLN